MSSPPICQWWSFSAAAIVTDGDNLHGVAPYARRQIAEYLRPLSRWVGLVSCSRSSSYALFLLRWIDWCPCRRPAPAETDRYAADQRHRPRVNGLAGTGPARSGRDRAGSVSALTPGPARAGKGPARRSGLVSDLPLHSSGEAACLDRPGNRDDDEADRPYWFRWRLQSARAAGTVEGHQWSAVPTPGRNDGGGRWVFGDLVGQQPLGP